MKNIASTITAFCIILLITSCGDKNGQSSSTTTKSEATTATQSRPNPATNIEDSRISNVGGTITSRPLTDEDRKRVAKNSMKKGDRLGDQNQTDGSFSNTPTNGSGTKNVKKSKNDIQAGIPDACSLLNSEDVAKVLGVDANAIKVKASNSLQSPHTKSCFYRWDGASPNTGILVQVQGNPIPEEYAEWVSLFVSSKRTSGEKSMGSTDVHLYKKLEGLGDDGSYSHELGKYIWRDANNYVFMVAFNTNSAPAKQLADAKALGKIIMSNYKG